MGQTGEECKIEPSSPESGESGKIMKQWHWWVLAVVAIGGGVYGWGMVRGIRNNNPGNIRRTADQWQGLLPLQADSEFLQFKSPKWGIRAMARILRNYSSRGLNTIETIISRWAPSNENNTLAYIESVSKRVGVQPQVPLNLQSDIGMLEAVVKAIIKHENGINPYSDQTIREGITIA